MTGPALWYTRKYVQIRNLNIAFTREKSNLTQPNLNSSNSCEEPRQITHCETQPILSNETGAKACAQESNEQNTRSMAPWPTSTPTLRNQ